MGSTMYRAEKMLAYRTTKGEVHGPPERASVRKRKLSQIEEIQKGCGALDSAEEAEKGPFCIEINQGD